MGLMGKLKEAQATARVHTQFDTRFGGVAMASGKILYQGTDRKMHHVTVAGVTAEYEGATTVAPRTTLTRVVAGGVVAGPVGAIVGGLFKKDRDKAYVTLYFPNGDTFTLVGPAKQDAQAREFARRITAAGLHYV